jgi:hypothetical protein
MELRLLPMNDLKTQKNPKIMTFLKGLAQFSKKKEFK